MTDPQQLPFPFFAPSDRLSHEAIGRADVSRHPDYAAVANAREKVEEIAERLHLGMKVHEQWLAEKAIARVKGTADPLPEKSREDVVNLLVEDYRAFGIAQGDHSARQLIREYESAVEDRARQEIGGQTR